MSTWCYCLNVTLLAGLYICTIKSNDCISTFLKEHEILLLPFWEGPPMQTLFRQSKHQFLKTHPSNQTEDLQTSIKEITNSRETTMVLKASTHIHSYFFSHRIQHCATFADLARDTPCHLLSARPALMEAAGAGTCPL